MNHKEKNVDFAKNSLTILVKIDKNICLDTKKIKQIFGEKNFNNFMKIVQYYNELFNDVLTCKIAVTAMPFEAISFRGTIVLHSNFIKRPYTYLYKYIPHEIIHQYNGCMIKYVGPAKEWMQESLTEYIQLIIVRKILGEHFYRSQCNEYKKLDTISGKMNQVSIYDFTEDLSEKFYKPLIYGRGVLLFQKIINSNFSILIKLFAKLKKVETEIDILKFMEILGEVMRNDYNLVLKKYIMQNTRIADLSNLGETM